MSRQRTICRFFVAIFQIRLNTEGKIKIRDRDHLFLTFTLFYIYKRKKHSLIIHREKIFFGSK